MGQGKILVIDDEKEITAFLEELLSNEGYQVSSASNGKDALKCLEKTEPDLIILDLIMPKGGGVSFYHSIARKTDGVSLYPVLILTGHSEYESVFQDLHVDGFMTKPFETVQLLEKVEKIIQKKHHKPSHAHVQTDGTSAKKAEPHHLGESTAQKHGGAEHAPLHFEKNTFIKDVMTTNVLTAHVASSTLGMNEKPSDKLSHVVEILRRHKIRHLPVVDGHQKLVGLISEDNLLRHLTPKHTEDGYEFDPAEIDELILEHVMTPNPVSVHQDDLITKATSIMAREKYGAIPVVDKDNKLVGIVSQIDFLRLLTRWLEAA